MDVDIRAVLKFASAALNYPEFKGTPIDRIDPHSLCGGRANTVSLARYSSRKIQRMGRWKRKTFKEYISDQLSNALKGMSKSMKTLFNSVNIKGGVCHDTATDIVNTP